MKRTDPVEGHRVLNLPGITPGQDHRHPNPRPDPPGQNDPVALLQPQIQVEGGLRDGLVHGQCEPPGAGPEKGGVPSTLAYRGRKPHLVWVGSAR